MAWGSPRERINLFIVYSSVYDGARSGRRFRKCGLDLLSRYGR